MLDDLTLSESTCLLATDAEGVLETLRCDFYVVLETMIPLEMLAVSMSEVGGGLFFEGGRVLTREIAEGLEEDMARTRREEKEQGGKRKRRRWKGGLDDWDWGGYESYEVDN